MEAREADPKAAIPLQPPRVPAEWKAALAVAEFAGAGRLAPKRFRVINNETYLRVQAKLDLIPDVQPPRPIKRLPKPKTKAPAPARTAPARTASNPRSTFGPATSKSSNLHGKAPAQVLDCTFPYPCYYLSLTTHLC